MTDIPAVSRCVPGVEEFAAVDPETFEGAMKVKVGPITVRLQGRVKVIERDHEARTSRLEVSAAEKRIASTVSARTTMTVVPQGDAQTDVLIHTEASILGKLGEFGQAVMKRKADQVVAEFAGNMAREIGGS
jgi:hypothetical protein